MTRAVVVGSGPNGLSAALTLAAEGVEVTVLEAADTLGGGTRSAELTLPGLVHDECSGFHPLAVDNPFTRRFDLDRHGLRWLWPEVQYAHPLDGSTEGSAEGSADGRGAAAWQSVERTAAALGRDESAWLQVFGPLSRRFDDVAVDFLRPLAHVPRHPFALAGFGLRAVPPASVLARRWSTPEARALFAGAAAHAMRPFSSPVSSAVGVALATSAHRYGWPVAEGGSAAISRATSSMLRMLGGRVETGVEVTSLDQLDRPDLVMLDVAPAAAARIVGDRMPARVRPGLRPLPPRPGRVQGRLRGRGRGAVELPARPSRGHRARRRQPGRGRARRARGPPRPDARAAVRTGRSAVRRRPGRSRDGVDPLYAYAHVPSGFTGDATAAIEAQIERFAPGFRERVLARHVTTTGDLVAHNANYVGGDVVTGANTPTQLLFRPRFAADPYSTGVDGVYLCSAATPPGAGAHGMCGWNAARSALRRL